MSKKIVIHVGAGKTGSTSIQQALFASKSSNDSVLFYPNILESNGSQIFRFAFCESSQTPSNIKSRFGKDGSGECYFTYQEEIKKSFALQCENYESVIVSSEFLFLSNKDEAARIKLFLKSIGFSEIHVVMYLRHPAPYYLSVAQQALKNQSNMPDPSSFKYDMEGAIEVWSGIEPTSVTVREFSRARLKSGDVVVDFSNYLLDLGFVTELSPVSDSNASMTVESTVALQDYHAVLESVKFGYEERKKFKLIARRFSNMALSGTKPVLNKTIRDYIDFRFTDVIKGLQIKYGLFEEKNVEAHNVEILCPKVIKFSDITTDFNFNCYISALRKLSQSHVKS